MTWATVDTAPSGQTVQVCYQSTGLMLFAALVDANWYVPTSPGELVQIATPTHWQPKPAPP